MPQNNPYTLEICVDTPEGISAASQFADRIELCQGLDIGGLTPDIGLMKYAAKSGIETHVLIRGRSGDFRMTAEDVECACSSIRMVRDLGLTGVVIGAEQDQGLDLSALAQMAQAGDGLDLTLHRVIDVVEDPIAAIAAVKRMGFKRVLTSGAAPTVQAGLSGLQKLCEAGEADIQIMAGGGVHSSILPDLLAQTSIRSFHSSCSARAPLAAHYKAFGFGDTERKFDPEEAHRLRAILDAQHLRASNHE